MFCKYCGKEMDNDSLFCPKCGKQVVPEKVVDSDTENSTDQKEGITTVTKTEKEQSQEEIKVPAESVTKVKKGKSKTGVKIILSILGLVVIGAGYFGYMKFFAPKSTDRGAEISRYVEKNWPIYEAAENRFNDAVDKYNANKSTANAENSSRAGLDMIESYLDYYKGLVKVKGPNDYSEMNRYMDESIALVEGNHSIHGPYREEVITTHSRLLNTDSTKTTTYTYGETDKFRNYFDKRIESLKAEWKRVRR